MNLSEKIWELERHVSELTTKNAELLQQLPEGMQHCTIRFKECLRGHGCLTATNSVDHPCPTCEIVDLREQLALSRTHNQILIENATKHETRMAKALHDRLVVTDELNSLRQAYSELMRSYERLRYTVSTINQREEGPIAADEHGPIYKDDLCPDALRDGHLRRSKGSVARRTAKPPKQEGDAGIVFTTENECTRENCPTRHPHKHLTGSPGIETSTNNAMHPQDDLAIAARRARMMATIEDADSDAFPTRTNPNHVKEDASNCTQGHQGDAPASDEPAADENFSLSAGTSDETSNTPDKRTEQR